jgi:hypothetical protein
MPRGVCMYLSSTAHGHGGDVNADLSTICCILSGMICSAVVRKLVW